MAERKTVRKWYWVWEFEKEEQWLNEMALNGWLLDAVGIATYHFTACEPGKYAIRIEMRRSDEAYIRFMEETGAEYIGRMVSWIYFRKPVQCGAFDLFSDLDSQITHLDRIGKCISFAAIANLLIGIINSFNPAVNIGWLNLLCATVLTYALGRIHGKKENLKRDRVLHE